MTRILVVDNHDSFVFTLVGYLSQLGADVDVIEADEFAVADVADTLAAYDGVMISPGPGAAQDAGVSVDVVRIAAAIGKPLIGVCLGHQAIAVAFGAVVSTAPELKHGMVSSITHDGESVFAGLPSPLKIGRYHSLAIDPPTLPADLVVTATTDSGVIMGVRHVSSPIHGVQFHPESVLTEHGYEMLATWLETTGAVGARDRAKHLSPLG